MAALYTYTRYNKYGQGSKSIVTYCKSHFQKKKRKENLDRSDLCSFVRFGLVPERSKNCAHQAPEHTVMVKTLAILKPVTKPIDAFIASWLMALSELQSTTFYNNPKRGL
jgi:hypothetical protein